MFFFNRILLPDNFDQSALVLNTLKFRDLVYFEYFCVFCCVYVVVVAIIQKCSLFSPLKSEIVCNIEEGSKPADVAETFGVSKRTVYGH